MKEKLRAVLLAGIGRCFRNGLLKEIPIPDYVIEIPNSSEHGHFATNLAMAFAAGQKRSPREIAEIIVTHLPDAEDMIEKAEVAGPGFINFRIHAREWYRYLFNIIKAGDDYGRNFVGNKGKILVEFVSANPTGPLHVGHGRGAALGDTLCRILSFCGYAVSREFYINDAGNQLRLLGESVYSRYKQTKDPAYPFPENGYHGDYVVDLAGAVSADNDLGNLSLEEAIQFCAQKGKEIMFQEIQEILSRFRVDFDIWYSEKGLLDSGRLEQTLEKLREEGRLYRQEDAEWIRTAAFGDDKDRVIRKKDGQYTYFASDIAYHLEKHDRGFDRTINIWGADHHGYIPRVQAALASQGIDKDWLSVMLIQLVKLWEGGQEMKMSKRAGSFVTLKELIDQVGVDAVRFVFLTKHHDSPLDFDLDVVKKQDSENPVYYVQYAHARICSIFRKSAEQGLDLPAAWNDDMMDRLALDQEMALIRKMAEFTDLLADIGRKLEPHRLTYFLTDLAASFHSYFNLGNKTPECRIITPDTETSQARLVLIKALQIVIANGLRLLGVSAPEKM